MKELTEKEWKWKAEHYCIQAERAPGEVRRKMEQWGVPADLTDKIMNGLFAERYLDTERFARAFARDKMRYNHWGKKRIALEMRQKEIPDACIEAALSELERDEYRASLQKIILQKQKQVTGKNEYEKKQKVIRFALGRGFSWEDILQVIDGVDEVAFPDDADE